MRRIWVADGLMLEVRSEGEEACPLIRLRVTARREAGSDGPGVVVVYPDEVDGLIAALTDAAAVIDSRMHKEAKR
ncbi:MAG TPA: hypothetical protein ENK08_01915 [Chloroflexi bacterium]|nr:hypothetical protein [Chloroflexota bacterium]